MTNAEIESLIRRTISPEEIVAEFNRERDIGLAWVLFNEPWLEDLTRFGPHHITYIEHDSIISNFLDNLDIPQEYYAAIEGLKEWEYDLQKLCGIFLYAQKSKLNLKEALAKAIGYHVSAELLAGRYGAARFVSECLLSLADRKPLRAEKARLTSLANIRVLISLFYLRKKGIVNPSQGDVRDLLAKHGHTVSRAAVAKVFAKLKLRKYSSDARVNRSDAGKRRRAKG